MTTNSSTSPNLASTSTDHDSDHLLAEELPPAYTAVADTRHGETTIEFGPSRPFQPPPPRPTPYTTPRWPQQPSATPTGGATWYRPATSGWQSNWAGGYPGQVHCSTTSVSTPRVGNRPPPPRHPAQGPSLSLSTPIRGDGDELFPSFTGSSHQQPHQRSSSSSLPSTNTGSSSSYAPPPGPPPPDGANADTEFRRDFYSAGTDDTALLGGTSDQYERGAHSEEDARISSPRSPGGINGHATGNGILQDDGRPTEKPVPGHPLLNNGRVLVYPVGFECMKCQNTGYKHYDPSHPCSKCWQKYSKPFSGPIAYAPWGSSSSSSPTSPSGSILQPHSNLNLQRPLRVIGSKYPNSFSQNRNSLPPSSSYPGLTRSTTSPTSRPPPPTNPNQTFPPPQWSSNPQPPPPPTPQQRSSYRYTPTSGPPPPGALVVQAGDPRLGGRRCWRCDGTGAVSLFFFDSSTCDACGGMGRVFN